MNEAGPIPSPATMFWLAVNAPAISFALSENSTNGVPRRAFHQSGGFPMKPFRAVAIMLALATGPAASAFINTVTNVNDSGAGSLRQQILFYNGVGGDDEIRFDIPGPGPHTINLLTSLPAITDSGTIDALTQTNGATIILDGFDIGPSGTGLVIQASLVTVRGFTIQNFADSGIVIDFNQTLNAILGNTLTGNGGQGIDIEGNNNTIAGNTIFGNGEDGVFVIDGQTRNRITQNSIYSNGSTDRDLGIDLFPVSGTPSGVTVNDVCDGDAGGNNLQNFPGLTGATSDGTNTTITGTLNSTSNAIFIIEFFANTECDDSGFGEGKTYLGTTNVTTDGSCAGAFSVILPVGLADGTQLTATATDSLGNTSEFSPCFPVTGPQPHDLAVGALKAPKKVTLKTGVIPKASKVQVGIQNLSAHPETINDFATLSNLVTLTVESLATNCATPTAVLQPPKSFPVTLKPKGKLKLTYLVTINCANDPLANSKTSIGHEDYRYTVTVDHSALDGNADTNPPNDDCPRAPSGGGDKGCGGKDPVTKQLGADVLTDVIVKP